MRTGAGQRHGMPHLRNSFLHIRDKSLLLHTDLLCRTTTPDKTKEQPAAPQVQQQRARKAGECWRSGDKWVTDHKCKLIPTINVMQETYTPNDATEEIPVQKEEEIPLNQDSPPNEYLMLKHRFFEFCLRQTQNIRSKVTEVPCFEWVLARSK
jgi:hypothetical protein